MARAELDKAQYVTFLILGLFPGVLYLLKLISPQQATLVVLLTYFMSRLYTGRLQKQFEEQQQKEKAAEEEKRRQEEEALAAFPAKKRKNILKGMAKKQEGGQQGLEEEEQEGKDK